MRTLFFDRLVDRVKRTGPIDDLDVLVDLAMRGYWNAISPIQSRPELIALLKVLKQARPSRVLEIGTANGGTLFPFTRIAATDALLVSVDLPGGPGGGGYPADRIPLYQAFPLPGQRLELIRDDSHDPSVLKRVAELVGDQGLEFLFIDGDHSYEGVRRDYEMYGPLVKPNGLIAFHDIEFCPDVQRFWDEVKVGKQTQELLEGDKQRYGIGLIYT
jgi:cephalosporin hydroxylase